MLENEFHKLEEKQEIRTTISQIRKEIKKQDSKKAFLELLQGKESMIVDFLSEEDAKIQMGVIPLNFYREIDSGKIRLKFSDKIFN